MRAMVDREISDASPHVADDWGLRIGQRIEHFRVVDAIGRGGMGALYRADDESLDRYVALKVIDTALSSSGSGEQVAQLLHEARAQARVNHPNVAHIYYVGSFNALRISTGERHRRPEMGTIIVDRLLVIDDDTELCEMLHDYLESEGFRVESVNGAADGIEQALAGHHALVVLDVMLPGMSGFEVLKQIRAKSSIPVLMLTARGDEVDRIVGLEVGADDYLPKPFNPRELVARIRAVLRRAEIAAAPTSEDEGAEVLAVGDVEMDLGARCVRLGGRDVELTSVEFDLLGLLLRFAGRTVSREEISRSVLQRRLHPLDRSIDVHISSLRRKLGRLQGDSERIRTIRGIGYLYARPGKAS